MGASRESGAGLEFVTVAPRVFLSYRRADTLDVAQGLSKWLREDLGGANVFRDEEDLIGGQSWQDVLTDTIRAADATLVLIGETWLGVRADGTRRIDEADDPVRSEVRDALKDRRSGSPIPVLVDIAEPPT